jgi:hypothetical protein
VPITARVCIDVTECCAGVVAMFDASSVFCISRIVPKSLTFLFAWW